MKFIVKLLKKEKICENTYGFYFEKPKNFNFLPGQWVSLKILNERYKDEKGNVRPLSIASSPNEDYLFIVTRVRESLSAFKKNLLESEIGEKFEIIGPFGNMIFKPYPKILMFAGGIAIAPFRSMILYAKENKINSKIILFYSNRTLNEIAFYEELKNLENENLKVIFTLTREKPKDWKYEIGRIDENMIKKYVEDLENYIAYIAGSQEFVNDIKKILEKKVKEIITEFRT